ncbi:hypothetical protein [Actinophytocola glycyrrhizae]|uniref:DUF3037 domain-containing protein n=1 Tax=Actinophytocola glycyrrhizae TaxID=2044873 RepID=A0ABV9S7Z2_9PSEU
MNADWDVIRYLPDLKRGEPRNIGVALIVEGIARVRFFAEQEPGKVDGRSVRTRVNDLQNYKEWIAYFRRKAASGHWEDVKRSRLRRPDYPYYIDRGGVIFDVSPENIDVELDALYQEVVADPNREGRTSSVAEDHPDSFAEQVDRILQSVPAHFNKNVTVPGVFAGGPRGGNSIQDNIRFRFGYQNGRMHLMDNVSSPPYAYSFFARAEAAYRVDTTLSFLAFYRRDKFGRNEGEIDIIERYANTVDVEDEEAAIDLVAEIVGVERTRQMEPIPHLFRDREIEPEPTLAIEPSEAERELGDGDDIEPY